MINKEKILKRFLGAQDRLVILDGDLEKLSAGISKDDIVIRFLEYDGKRYWRDLLEGNQKATKRSEDMNSLKRECIQRARRLGQVVIIRNKSGIPDSWLTPDVD